MAQPRHAASNRDVQTVMTLLKAEPAFTSVHGALGASGADVNAMDIGYLVVI